MTIENEQDLVFQLKMKRNAAGGLIPLIALYVLAQPYNYIKAGEALEEANAMMVDPQAFQQFSKAHRTSIFRTCATNDFNQALEALVPGQTIYLSNNYDDCISVTTTKQFSAAVENEIKNAEQIKSSSISNGLLGLIALLAAITFFRGNRNDVRNILQASPKI